MDKPIKKAANDRTNLIEGLINIIEKKLGTAQDEMFRAVIENLVDRMERDGDQVKNTLANKRLIALVDNVFTDFARGKGSDVALSVIRGVSQIMDFNGKYFSVFSKPAELAPINESVKETLSDWLGISKKGLIEPNGYLDTIINDPRIKNQVKDLTVKTVVSQAGFFETKAALKDFIVGNEDNGNTGALRKYYRNFVYDTFSTIDRTASKITADKLKLNFALYEGGLIETSRKFCKDHNGNVYSREEIEQMDITEARPPGYNPFTDMGGYGCRHHWNWIPDAVAKALRPDLKDGQPAPAPTKEDKPAVEDKQPAKRETPPANVPFDDVKPLPRKEFVIKSKKYDADTKELEKHGAKADELNKQKSDLLAAYNKENKVYQANYYKSSPEEQTKMLFDLQGTYEKYANKLKELKQHQETGKEIKSRINAEIKAVLLKDKPKNKVGVSIKSATLAGDEEFMKKIPAALDFYRVASQKWLPENFVMNVRGVVGGARAHYFGGEIFMSKGDSAKVIVHEMGHHLETHNQVFKEAVDFLERRTAGNPVRKLKEINKGYKANEIFKDGGFPNEYDGKIYRGTRYGDKSYTEIVSRGLEYMFDDPATFLRKDKDYFNFIYTLFF